MAAFRKVSIAENLNCDYSDCEYSEVSPLKAFHHYYQNITLSQAKVVQDL